MFRFIVENAKNVRKKYEFHQTDANEVEKKHRLRNIEINTRFDKKVKKKQNIRIDFLSIHDSFLLFTAMLSFL